MDKNFIFLLGPQSSGKSTQAKLLADFLNYKFISTGKLLRRLSEADNPVGIKLSEYWRKGELVPDKLMEEILFPILEKDVVAGFVLDGFPRDVEQLKSFLAFLELNHWTFSAAFYLEVSDSECLVRLSKRATEEGRLDDADERVIKRRIDVYKQETEPLLDSYSKLGKLVRVDGERTIEEIQKDLQGIVKLKLLANT